MVREWKTRGYILNISAQGENGNVDVFDRKSVRVFRLET